MKLLFNYLTHSMKESDSAIRSNKNNGTPSKANKANGNNKNGKTKPSTSGTEIKLTKFFSSFKANGNQSTNGSSSENDKKQSNSHMNGTPRKRSNSNSVKTSPSSRIGSPAKSPPLRKKSTSITTSASASAKKRAIERALKKIETSPESRVKRKLSLDNPLIDGGRKKLRKEPIESTRERNGKSIRKRPSAGSPKSKRTKKRVDSECSEDSDKSRPRRRASQTYFFKYQLARNPLKAEEEDLKQALLASLEQCGQQKSTSSKKQQQLLNDLLLQDQSSNTSTNSKTTKHNQRENHHQKQPRKHHPKHPSNNKQIHSKTSSLSIAQTMAPVTPAIVATSTPPTYDEEYLEKYRPDTEDFLAFICFRVTAPNFSSRPINQKSNDTAANQGSKLTNGYSESKNLSSITGSLNIKIEPNNNVSGCSRQVTSSTNTSPMIDEQHHNLRRSVSPYKFNSNSTSSTASNQLSSPLSNRRRPPTRQSPRLASTQQKISDPMPDGGFNRIQHFQMNSNTAFDQNPINYEEDLKRASIALEDMAQEITKSNGTDTPVSSVKTRQQNGKSLPNHNLLLSTADAIERHSHDHQSKHAQISSTIANALPFKSNKHLVKGLMTREFAGTFADEEIIFESISNHKL